jgi:hypothetical protein
MEAEQFKYNVQFFSLSETNLYDKAGNLLVIFVTNVLQRKLKILHRENNLKKRRKPFSVFIYMNFYLKNGEK